MNAPHHQRPKSLVDLHCHSSRSDGILAPAELVQRAHESGVETLALTDHDSTDGLDEAKNQTDQLGMTLIPGVEISTSWGDKLFHIVGLGIDPDYKPLVVGLKQLRDKREQRAALMASRLEKAGIPDTLNRALELADGGMVTRTHFARVLVEKNKAKDTRSVFKHYLTNGHPGFVKVEWAELSEVVGWIRNAGGQAVLAHPLRYRLTGSWIRKFLTAFKLAKGTGIEVVCGSHSPPETLTCAGYAARYELMGSVGSDFHDPDYPYIGLGRLAALPDHIKPIWENL